MITQEENLIFSDKEKNDNEKPFEYNFLINQNIPNKSDIFIKIKANIFNSNKVENIPLEEIKNILEGPKIDLEEEESSEELYFTKNSKTDLQSTCTSTKNISFVENKEENFRRNVNFTIILKKKRGRRIKKESNKKNKKCHCSDDFDNIQRKIQVDFINFLIRLANDALKSIFGQKTKYNFKHVNYELKKIVSHNYIEYLKKCNYSDIMQMKISPKNKLFGEDSNKETFIKVCKYSDILKKIFEKNYLYLFQKYYCCLINNKNIIDLEGLKILLSPKTKTLFNLLKKNEPNKAKFLNVVKDVYFSEINYISDKKFITSSSIPPVPNKKIDLI